MFVRREQENVLTLLYYWSREVYVSLQLSQDSVNFADSVTQRRRFGNKGII